MTDNSKRRSVKFSGALMLALLAMVAMVFSLPLAFADNGQGQVVAQATTTVAATPASTTRSAAPTQNAAPTGNTNTNPGTNTGTSTGPVATTTTPDNSWLLWLVLGIVLVAALAGGAWYYPRRSGTVTRTTTEYRDDGPRADF